MAAPGAPIGRHSSCWNAAWQGRPHGPGNADALHPLLFTKYVQSVRRATQGNWTSHYSFSHAIAQRFPSTLFSNPQNMDGQGKISVTTAEPWHAWCKLRNLLHSNDLRLAKMNSAILRLWKVTDICAWHAIKWHSSILWSWKPCVDWLRFVNDSVQAAMFVLTAMRPDRVWVPVYEGFFIVLKSLQTPSIMLMRHKSLNLSKVSGITISESTLMINVTRRL